MIEFEHLLITWTVLFVACEAPWVISRMRRRGTVRSRSPHRS
jgi:hypothetical protein